MSYVYQVTYTDGIVKQYAHIPRLSREQFNRLFGPAESVRSLKIQRQNEKIGIANKDNAER